jgi:hypothetical protein
MERPDIEAIRKRVEAATPGPWEHCTTDPMTPEAMTEHVRKHLSFGTRDTIEGVMCPRHPMTTIGPDPNRPTHAVKAASTGNGPDSIVNAQFIAAARTDVPLLLAYIAHLEREATP